MTKRNGKKLALNLCFLPKTETNVGKREKNTHKICIIEKKVVPLHPQKKTHRGVEQLVARQAHNLEVACSSPASATKNKKAVFLTAFFFFFFLF